MPSSGKSRAQQLYTVTSPPLFGADTRRSTRKHKSSGGRLKRGGSGGGMVSQARVVEDGQGPEVNPETRAESTEQEASEGLAGQASEATAKHEHQRS